MHRVQSGMMAGLAALALASPLAQPPSAATRSASTRSAATRSAATRSAATRSAATRSAATPPAPIAAARQAPMMAVVDPGALQGLKYRLVGPSRGGRVTTVTGVPSQPRTFYMGVASGGAVPDDRRRRELGADHRRQGPARLDGRDRGRRLRSEHHLRRHRLRRRAQQRVDRPRRLQDDRRRRDLAVRRPLQRRTDRRGPHPSRPIRTSSGSRPTGDIFKANTERGVFKTIDGGKTWKKMLFVTDSVGAMDVELQPGNPNVVYAWMSRLERKPWTIISGARDGGFYKSTDGGETFTKIATGLPGELIGKGNLAVTAANPDRIYALDRGEAGRRLLSVGRRGADVDARQSRRPR